MRCKNFRFVAVVAVTLVITFALLPTAEARDLAGSRASVHNTTDWFGAALTWVANLLHPGHGGSAGLRHQSSASGVISPPNPGGTHYVPNTGSCIDPLGGHCTM